MLKQALTHNGLIAILRGLRPEEALAIGEVLYTAGFRVIEVPLNSPDPYSSIRILRDGLPADCLIGAGTVLTPEQVDQVKAAGGQVIVMPHSDAKVLRAAKAVHFQPTRRLLTAVEPEPAPQGEILLEARELSKTFIGPDGKTRTVLNQVSLQLRRGETLGVVGESGCGKTTLTRLILGLETADAGEVWINGQRWSDLDARQKREARRAVQVVFQDPLSSFDPRYTVQRVLFEALVVAGVPRHARRDRALELLELVRLDASALSRRPIELSGGQRQRIAIARALASEPQILICDEPVSALDVSVQAQILELLDDLKRRLGLACLFISHDLGVINHVSERVLVMKAGEVVESGSVRAVFDRPAHAYTRALIDAIPTLETDYTPIPFYLNVAI